MVHGGRGPCAAAWGLVLDDTAAQLVATTIIPLAVMVGRDKGSGADRR